MLVAIALFFSASCRNINLPFSSARYSEKCFCEYFMGFFCSFSYRSKLISESVSNIIARDWLWYHHYLGRVLLVYLWLQFLKKKEIWFLSMFSSCYSDLFQVFIITSLFTSPRKVGQQVYIFFLVTVKLLFKYRVLFINEIYKKFIMKFVLHRYWFL